MGRIYKIDSYPYNCKQMFSLVADVNSYRDFVPACEDSYVISTINNPTKNNGVKAEVKKEQAKLCFRKGKIQVDMTTENTQRPYKFIKMSLVEGDMRHLEGEWSFSPHKEGCLIEFNCKYEMKNSLMGFLANRLIDNVWQTLMERMMQRANEIYEPR